MIKITLAIAISLMLVNFACNRVEDTDQFPLEDGLTPKTEIQVTSADGAQSLPSTLENVETPVSVTQIPVSPLATSISTPVEFISVSSHDDSMTTVEAVRELEPSVVQIATDTVAISLYNRIVPQTGVGSGIILDKAGNILTNNHVIEGADYVTVTLSDGRSYPANLVGSDSITDLAVIKIAAAKLTPAKFGNSSNLEVGEDVIAVGHALGLKGGPTVSKGVVSALDRTIQTDAQKAMVDLIQTDASINPGNSGGPLANSRGEVIGINTAIINDSNGIGFAININDAHVVVDQILRSGYVMRGFLGITPFNVTDSIREQLNLPVADGVIIAGVVEGFPAGESGLQTEDVIVMLNKAAIENSGDLSKFLLNNPPGSNVEVSFYRNGELRKVELVLADKPD